MTSSTKDADLADVLKHYKAGQEENRLTAGHGQLEWERTTQILNKYLPAPPAVVLQPHQQSVLFHDGLFSPSHELADEVTSAGFVLKELVGLEGPTWFLQHFSHRWSDPQKRQLLLDIARRTGSESSLLGTSAHLLAIARAEEGRG